MIGPVVSITTDAGGNPTSFNLWVHDAEPDIPTKLTMDTLVQVNLPYGTTFPGFGPGAHNFANLTFGPGKTSR